MTQEALFTEPHWTDAWAVGQSVSDPIKGSGTVVAIETGGLLIRWTGHEHWGDWMCFHGSEMGLS